MGKITLEEARRVVRAGLESGREQGVGMGVAVVDYAGQIVAFERDDDAMWIVSEIAWRKARTSAAFGKPTADREQAWAVRPFFARSVVGLGDFVVGKGAVRYCVTEGGWCGRCQWRAPRPGPRRGRGRRGSLHIFVADIACISA